MSSTKGQTSYICCAKIRPSWSPPERVPDAYLTDFPNLVANQFGHTFYPGDLRSRPRHRISLQTFCGIFRRDPHATPGPKRPQIGTATEPKWL